MLYFAGNGIMDCVEIPEIDVHLPIYHGTDAETFDIGLRAGKNKPGLHTGNNALCVFQGLLINVFIRAGVSIRGSRNLLAIFII